LRLFIALFSVNVILFLDSMTSFYSYFKLHILTSRVQSCSHESTDYFLLLEPSSVYISTSKVYTTANLYFIKSVGVQCTQNSLKWVQNIYAAVSCLTNMCSNFAVVCGLILNFPKPPRGTTSNKMI